MEIYENDQNQWKLIMSKNNLKENYSWAKMAHISQKGAL